MMLGCVVLTQYSSVTDGQTDGRTDASAVAKTWHMHSKLCWRPVKSVLFGNSSMNATLHGWMNNKNVSMFDKIIIKQVNLCSRLSNTGSYRSDKSAQKLCDLDLWPMTLKFSRLVEVVKVHTSMQNLIKLSAAVQKLCDDVENNTALASAGSKDQSRA